MTVSYEQLCEHVGVLRGAAYGDDYKWALVAEWQSPTEVFFHAMVGKLDRATWDAIVAVVVARGATVYRFYRIKRGKKTLHEYDALTGKRLK